MLSDLFIQGHDVGCFGINILPYTYPYWIPVVAYETVPLLLASWKTMQCARWEGKTPNLTVVLFRDSLLFFGAILAAVLLNCVEWATGLVCY